MYPVGSFGDRVCYSARRDSIVPKVCSVHLWVVLASDDWRIGVRWWLVVATVCVSSRLVGVSFEIFAGGASR